MEPCRVYLQAAGIPAPFKALVMTPIALALSLPWDAARSHTPAAYSI